MKDNKLKDNLCIEEDTEGVIFNHFSFCEILKHIMVEYGKIKYEKADKKLREYFLYEAPKSMDDVHYITHELEYHWAMLIVHGDMYWTKGIPSDWNDFEDEYLTWKKKVKLKYKLKDSYKYYEIETNKTTANNV